MFPGDALGLLLGAVALGVVHGLEPGHGWPIAASYALDRSNKWAYGFAASAILGVGHLVSSIAMVVAFFYAKSYFELTAVNDPISITPTVSIGGPVSLVAGALLIVLGVYEYTHGHSHDHGDANHGHPHDHGEAYHGHSHDHSGSTPGILDRLRDALPFVGSHSHQHEPADATAERSLLGIAWFAFLLGFAHEEEFEIIALCAGSNYCLELMTAYALTVIVAIVGLTLALIAGYQRYEERVSRITPYLPTISAAVLVVMGLGFIAGLV